ncbi:type I restriction-modification system subunit M [Hydrogenovibrio crunogenus]|uniref:site-specific DNA-methyltransferase (adenine-specific) n=1 Tax=Hydrogenovibrio crunogenus TaxID=39765 RepID=A0A4P7NY98_9GAMM|nr:type I restriction-modification system subunit M [Hydrogenovibrio crunogenus]
MDNNFSKNFKQAIQNQDPCEIVYVLLQIKLALVSLNELDETSVELGLTELIKGRHNNRSHTEMATLKATETKNRLKDEVHRFAKSNDLYTDLFDNLDAKMIVSLTTIALTTDNLSLELRKFMDDNPRRTGVNFTPVVIRRLMQSVLLNLTSDKEQTSLLDPLSRTGDLVFSWPPLPFSKIGLNSDTQLEREVAKLFWNVVMLDQHDLQSNEPNIVQQTVTTTPVKLLQNHKPKKEKYDAVLSSIASSTGTVNHDTRKAKTHSTAWVEAILEILNDNGVAVLLIEDGFFHRTTFDYEFREQLVKKDLVEMIIALPANLYFKNAHFNASILVINKNKPVHAKNKVKLFHLHELKNLKLDEIEKLAAFTSHAEAHHSKKLPPNLINEIASL